MGHYENNNLLERETEGRKHLIERERNGERGKWGGEKKWLVRGEIGGGGCERVLKKEMGKRWKKVWYGEKRRERGGEHVWWGNFGGKIKVVTIKTWGKKDRNEVGKKNYFFEGKNWHTHIYEKPLLLIFYFIHPNKKLLNVPKNAFYTFPNQTQSHSA